MQHVDFGVQTLWTLAHVQESPLDKIYVLLMIFIGPLAQRGGKLPRNLKESCFRLVVRRQSHKIQQRRGEKIKYFYSGTRSLANLAIVISFVCLFWSYGILLYRGIFVGGSFLTKSWKVLLYPFVCICLHCVPVQCHKMANMIHSFLFPTEWMIFYIPDGISGKPLCLY